MLAAGQTKAKHPATPQTQPAAERGGPSPPTPHTHPQPDPASPTPRAPTGERGPAGPGRGSRTDRRPAKWKTRRPSPWRRLPMAIWPWYYRGPIEEQRRVPLLLAVRAVVRTAEPALTIAPLHRPCALDGTSLRAWVGLHRVTLGYWTAVAYGRGRGRPVPAHYWCVLAATDCTMNPVRYPRRRGTA